MRSSLQLARREQDLSDREIVFRGLLSFGIFGYVIGNPPPPHPGQVLIGLAAILVSLWVRPGASAKV